jgi:pyruvate ferredoxin oxidoreductase gamma subunit
MMLQGIDYQYCKGCLKCVEVCPVHPAALVEIPETEGYADSHRARRYVPVTHAQGVAVGARPGPRKEGEGQPADEEMS